MTELQIDRPAAGVLRLMLDGAGSLNALDDGVKRQLLAALRDSSTDECAVVLLTGAGRAFCAGGDVNGMGKRTAAETVGVLDFGRQIIESMMSLSKPVVVGVNGIASGAGFNLALAGDIVLAADSAWFQQSFVRIGLVPDMGGTYLLAQAIGLHRAKRALLTGHRFSSAEALALGFVSEVYAENFAAEAVAYCERLARKAPLALGLTKILTNRSVDGSLQDALDRESTAQAVLSTTDDHKAAVEAFHAKADLDSIVFAGR